MSNRLSAWDVIDSVPDDLRKYVFPYEIEGLIADDWPVDGLSWEHIARIKINRFGLWDRFYSFLAPGMLDEQRIMHLILAAHLELIAKFTDMFPEPGPGPDALLPTKHSHYWLTWDLIENHQENMNKSAVAKALVILTDPDVTDQRRMLEMALTGLVFATDLGSVIDWIDATLWRYQPNYKMDNATRNPVSEYNYIIRSMSCNNQGVYVNVNELLVGELFMRYITRRTTHRNAAVELASSHLRWSSHSNMADLTNAASYTLHMAEKLL
jgi:hypothetical protein